MRMILRFAEPEDAAGMLAIYGPYCESSFVSFEIVAPTVQEMCERITRISADHPWLVCDAAGEVAGYVYASRHRERAAYRWGIDVAVYIAERFRRRGVGRALYTSLFALLREQGYFKAYAGVTLPNPGSVALHEAMGFRQVAVFPAEGFKLGGWRDVGWWELSLQPLVADPPELTSWRIVRESGAAVAALAEGERMLRSAEEG